MADENVDTSAADAAIAAAEARQIELDARERSIAVREAGFALDSDAGRLLIANPSVDIAAYQATIPAPVVVEEEVPDSGAAERQALAVGAEGETGVAEGNPYDVATHAMNEAMNGGAKRVDALASAVAVIRSAAQRGDQRVLLGAK